MSGRTITPTGVLAAPADLPEEEWLALRKTGLGGSDIAALVGLSRYASPMGLYLEKRGELPPMQRPAALMRAAHWGHRHEQGLADEFAARHEVSVRKVGLIRHVSESWRLASLDRQVAGCPDGPCLFEAKSRSAYKEKEWGESGDPDGVPDEEALQTHWYMGVTGYRHAHVGVLINGNDDRYYRVEYDRDIDGDVTAMARSFWQRVLDGNPPPADGATATTELLAQLWTGREKEQKVVDRAGVEPLKAELDGLKAEAEAVEARIAALKNTLAAELGEAEEAVWDGELLFSRRQNGAFNPKRFSAAHPDLAEKYAHLVPAIDTKALAAEQPELYRAFRARVLRFHGGMK